MARSQIKIEAVLDTTRVEAGYARMNQDARRFAATTQVAFAESAASAAKAETMFSRLNTSALLSGAAGGAAFAGATIAGEALVSALKTGIQNAALLENASQAIAVQFGDAADEVKKFAANASDLGISAVQSEQLSVRLGILLQNLGVGQEKAAKMTIGLQELAGAIAEIKGQNVETVFANLPQALAGNLRSLKQLGFAFTQTQIKAEAVREGLIGVNDVLTPGAKAQAIYALATQNLSGYLQQARNSSGDLINQQHILEAEFSNLETAVGKLVTGPLATFVNYLNQATSAALRLEGALEGLAKVHIPNLFGKGSSIGDALKAGFEGVVPGLGLPGAIKGLFGGGKSKTPTAEQQKAAAALIAQAGQLPAGGTDTFLAQLQAAGFNAGNRLKGPFKDHAAAQRERDLMLQELQAQLTSSTADDLAVAKAEEAFFKQQAELADKGSKAYRIALQQEVAAHAQIEAIEAQMQSEQDAHLKKLEAAEKKRAAAANAAAKKQAEEAKRAAQAITDEYKNAQQSAEQLFGTLFQGPVIAPTDAQRKAALGVPQVTAGVLLKDLQAQLAQFKRFERDLQKLEREGAPKGLVQQLRDQGPAAIPELEALIKSPRVAHQVFHTFGEAQSAIRAAAVDIAAENITIKGDRLTIQGAGGTNITINSLQVAGPNADKVIGQIIRKAKASTATRRGNQPGHNWNTGHA